VPHSVPHFDDLQKMKRKTKAAIWYTCLAFVFGGFSYLASYFEHTTLSILILVVPFALIVNGLIAEKEDEMPGGFNDPTDEKK